ncbi:MAG: hypothetical protein AAFY71_20120 [Bacteroidota bacterium]
MNIKSIPANWLVILLAVLMAGCCSPCEKPDLGEFTLSNEAKRFLTFSDRTEEYRSSDGRSVIITFTELNNGFVELVDNCDELNRCGLCCNNYRAEFVSVLGGSDDLSVSLEIAVSKDFSTVGPTAPAEEIPENMRILMNNAPNLNCILEEVVTTELTDVVTLNGRTFTKVFKCELENPNFVFEDTEVTGIYFTKDLGLVGYRTGPDVIWALP